MRNIISGKELTDAVLEGGLKAAQQFPMRCTGDTTGRALLTIGNVMVKQKHSNGEPVRVWIDGSEVREAIVQIINQMDLKGFRVERDYNGGMLHYHIFEGK